MTREAPLDDSSTGSESSPLFHATYDDFPYGARPVQATHVDHLFVEARRAGLATRHPSEARVLELGCAEGTNLLPMADRYEGARFVGVDAGVKHIRRATALRDRLGLENVELIGTDILDYRPDQKFDYIVCHGVLSWVPEEVRERIFAIVRDHLDEHGVAYVSYNVSAGWGVRSQLRRVLRARTRGAVNAHEAVAHVRGLLGLFADNPLASSRYAGYLADEARAALGRSDGYLVHEFLAAENVAFACSEVLARAARHALRSVGELTRGKDEDALREVVENITDEAGEREDLLDTLLGRAFRASLFAHSDAVLTPPGPALATAVCFGSALSPEERRPSLDPGDTEAFVTPTGERVGVEAPLTKAALLELHASTPRVVPFEALVARSEDRLRMRRVLEADQRATDAQREALAVDLLELHRLGHVALRASARDVAVEPGPLPRLSSLSRVEARELGWVSDGMHRAHELDGPARHLAGLLDGSRDVPTLASLLRAHLAEVGVVLRDEAGEPLAEEREQEFLLGYVATMLQRFTRLGILVR
jgi:2-polyprenyl-3-methyl-5-hydroxy-6-metoxy-1,4-benzoquinol methylase